MSTTTTNLGLTKPAGDELINIAVWNDNMDLIDAAVPPVGTVIDFAGASVPDGWLECDGSAVSRTAYAALFAALGTTWGSGDGSTTFNLPNLGGRVAIGKGTRSVGNTGGSETHALTPAETAMKNHSHTVPAHAHGLNSHKHKYDKANSSVTGGSHNHSLGSNSFAMIQLGGDYIKYRETKRTGASQIWTANWSQPTGTGGATSAGSEYSCDLGGVTATNSSHSHTLAYTSTDSGAASGNTANSTAVSTTGNPSDANGSAHNIMQPYAVVRKLIRAL